MNRLATSALATALTLLPMAASAEQTCAPRQIVLEHLSERFGESRQSIGMGAEGRVVEVFASTDTGTWTITITLPNGMTCLIAAGDGFENLSEDPAPVGEAS